MRALWLLPLGLAACTKDPTVVPTQRLAKPSASLMIAPQELPPVNAGDNLYEQTLQCRAEYGRLATKVVGLQNWVVIVTRARK